MKTLTVKQPWASLIANGYKNYEFRTWKTSYRGPLYIHAGKGRDIVQIKRFEHLNLNYPASKIVAKVNLVDCILLTQEKIDEIKNENFDIFGHLDESYIGTYAWKLENIELIESEDIVNGKLSLWE